MTAGSGEQGRRRRHGNDRSRRGAAYTRRGSPRRKILERSFQRNFERNAESRLEAFPIARFPPPTLPGPDAPFVHPTVRGASSRAPVSGAVRRSRRRARAVPRRQPGVTDRPRAVQRRSRRIPAVAGRRLARDRHRLRPRRRGVLAAAVCAGRVAVARPPPAARAAVPVRRLRARRLRSAGVHARVRVRVLERVLVPLQLHCGRLPDLHARGHRQHPRVVSDDAHRAGPGDAGCRHGVAHAAAALARRRADDDEVRAPLRVDGRVCAAGGGIVPGRAAELEGVQRQRAVAAARGQRRLGVLPRVQLQRDRLRPVLPDHRRPSGPSRNCARSSSRPGPRTSRTTRRCRSNAGSTPPARRRS